MKKAFSIIQRSQLEEAKRLDAEYYQPEYLHVLEKIRKFSGGFAPITELLSRQVVTGTTPKKRSCVGDGTDLKFVKTDVLREGMILFDQADCLPKKESRKNSEPRVGDIIITIIGATYDIVGRVARVYDDDPQMNINQNIALLRPKDRQFSSYLSLFLQGRYGRDQLWQHSRQTEQVNLNCREVENIIVPLPDASFLELVDKMILDAHSLLEGSMKFYSQAEILLLQELELLDFKEDESLSWMVNLSDVKTAIRVDAEYFQPKYEKLLAKIKSRESKLLPEIIENVPAKFDPSLKPDQSFKYVELSNINSSIGIIDGFSEVKGKEAPSRAKRMLEPNDIIVSSVEGSLEKVALVHEEQERHLGSTGFFQFRSKEILPEVLLILAKSPVLQMQFQKHCAGTILTAVPREAINKIVVPSISKTVQQKIAELVRRSHEARKRSKHLLEEAKRTVEETIKKEARG